MRGRARQRGEAGGRRRRRRQQGAPHPAIAGLANRHACFSSDRDGPGRAHQRWSRRPAPAAPACRPAAAAAASAQAAWRCCTGWPTPCGPGCSCGARASFAKACGRPACRTTCTQRSGGLGNQQIAAMHARLIWVAAAAAAAAAAKGRQGGSSRIQTLPKMAGVCSWAWRQFTEAN